MAFSVGTGSGKKGDVKIKVVISNFEPDTIIKPSAGPASAKITFVNANGGELDEAPSTDAKGNKTFYIKFAEDMTQNFKINVTAGKTAQSVETYTVK